MRHTLALSSNDFTRFNLNRIPSKKAKSYKMFYRLQKGVNVQNCI